MSKNDIIEIENKGSNEGVIVVNNTGSISIRSNESKKIPSLISKVVKSIATACSNSDIPDSVDNLKEFKPKEKLEYNKVIKYKALIEAYTTYYICCDDILNVYDNSNIGSKSKILNCIYTWYLQEKGELILTLKDIKKNEINKIQENSDYLIDKVKEKILNAITNSNIDDICLEDKEIAVACFICYCFMECKILEKPI